MLRVPRPKPPASLSGKAAEKERAEVAAFHKDWKVGDPPFDSKKFRAYKSDDVKEALEAAFGGKCAYCETYYAASQPLDVEHYRPKGGVRIDGKPVPPGYHWLASEWLNLLPSCTDCNRPRKQDLPDEEQARLAGKWDAFPLADESTRATAPGMESKERRLLLHPYLDHPEKHLKFIWGTGTIDDGWVVAARNSAKGRATITVCALQRRGLRAARRDRLVLLLAQLEAAVEAAENASRFPDEPVFMAQFERRLQELQQFVAPTAPYAAMCRQVVAAYHERSFGTKEVDP